MILQDILETINMNRNVIIYDDETVEIIAEYDGKNSIPESLNDREVTFLDIAEDEDAFEVWIK